MNSESPKEINLPYARITYSAPIVYFEYKDGTELGFPEVRELISCAEKMSGYKPYVTFSDVRIDINMTNEGKKVLADPNNLPLFRGTAAWVKNDIYKFAANFLNYFDRLPYPFRAFTDKDEAIQWLLSLPLNA